MDDHDSCDTSSSNTKRKKVTAAAQVGPAAAPISGQSRVLKPCGDASAAVPDVAVAFADALPQLQADASLTRHIDSALLLESQSKSERSSVVSGSSVLTLSSSFEDDDPLETTENLLSDKNAVDNLLSWVYGPLP